MLERIITYEPGRHDACDVMHSSCIHLQYRINRKVFVYKLEQQQGSLVFQPDELRATVPLVLVTHRLHIILLSYCYNCIYCVLSYVLLFVLPNFNKHTKLSQSIYFIQDPPQKPQVKSPEFRLQHWQHWVASYDNAKMFLQTGLTTGLT